MIGDNVIVSGLLISTAAAMAALACLYILTEAQYGAASARWTVTSMAVYPVAVFLIAPFSEALFIALTVGTFLAAYRRRWWLAGVLGALASLTRSQGMLTTLALAWIAWEQWRCTSPPRLPSTRAPWSPAVVVGLALPVLGGLAFFGWREAMGFAPYSELWRIYGGSAIANPVVNSIDAFKQFIVVRDLPVTLDVASALLFLGLTSVMLWNKRWRRPEWLIYMSASLLLFLSKRNDLASVLQSMSRYVLALFPGFVVIGDWLARRGPRLRFAYLVVSSTLLIILSSLYALWWFIG
jgi:hypothetical protein